MKIGTRIVALFAAVIITVALSACQNSYDPTMTAIKKRITEASTFNELVFCGDYDELTDDEEALLSEKVLDFLYSDSKLNGTYYYYDFGYISFDYDTIVVCVVSRDEVYIVPAEEAPADIADIPSMLNAEEYRYTAADGRAGEIYGKGGFVASNLLWKPDGSDEFDIYVTLKQDENESWILSVSGIFPYEVNSEGDSTPRFREYYPDEQRAIEIATQEYEEDLAKREAQREELEELSRSDPQIGMTEDEVEKCAWGKPDEINTDVYSWGVHEQWVYRGKGYVYLENGVVTSVSYR